MQDIVKGIISSYEARLQWIEAVFDDTHQLLQGFQDSFLNTRQEQERVRTELRESLARNGSLRRKDFDSMMQGILSLQDKREKEVKDLLKGYLNEQKGLAHTLRDNLIEVKEVLVRGEVQRVREFQALMKDILTRQDERKNEVVARLKEFQRGQQELAKRLKNLLAKGRELRVKDVRLMLKELEAQHKERIALREERQKEVRGLLEGFKKERIEAARNWQGIKGRLACK